MSFMNKQRRNHIFKIFSFIKISIKEPSGSGCLFFPNFKCIVRVKMFYINNSTSSRVFPVLIKSFKKKCIKVTRLILIRREEKINF